MGDLNFLRLLDKPNFTQPTSIARKKFRISRSAGLLGLIVASWAQAAPDAGSLLQHQRQTELSAERAADSPPLLSTPSRMLSLASGSQVNVVRFEIKGNSLVPGDQLIAAISAYQGRMLNLEELQRAASAVSKVYADRGYLARAYLPPQDITEGVILLQIEESRFGNVRVRGEEVRFDSDRASAFIFASQAPEGALMLPQIERGMLLLGDLPGFGVTGSLVAGQEAGQTDLVLNFSESPLFSGDARLDNHGSRSTGEPRVTANLSLNSALRFGDTLGVTLSHSRGNQYARLSAGVPLGVNGLHLSANVSRLRYTLTGSDFKQLNASGESDAHGLALAYPLLRSRAANIWVQAGGERKQFENRANGSVSSSYGSAVTSVGFSANGFDSAGGGGSNTVSLTFTRGDLDLAGSPSQAADTASARTAGKFTKLNVSAGRMQRLGDRWSLWANVYGQYADKNLDSSEKIYLGGPQGVRAYPVSEVGGSRGIVANLELRTELGQGLSAGLFVDWGQVSVNAKPGFAGATSPNTLTLKGAGLSLGWSGPGGLDVRATLAHRLGSNPAASLLGRDQDGSLVRLRPWLQASLPF